MTDVRDTQQLHAITGRQHATIRVVCRHLRGPGGYTYPDALELLDAHQDGEVVLLTAAEAERWMRIPAGTIYSWASRGMIRPVDEQGRGPRYRADQLATIRAHLDRKAQLDL